MIKYFTVLTTILIFVTLVHFVFYSNLLSAKRAPSKQCSCRRVDADPASKFSQEELSKRDPKGRGSSKESLALHHPNVPLELLNASLPRCSLMPHFMSIRWSGVVWQNFESNSGKEFLLYSAAYDNRTKTEPKGGAVRIVALVQASNITPSELPWCLLWYEGSLQPHVSRVVRAEYIDWQSRSADRLQSYVLTCPTPRRSGAPWGVSVVSEECTAAHNLLKVAGGGGCREVPSAGGGPRKKQAKPEAVVPEVGVCGPALFYYQEDFSVRLVEWLEVLKVLGVSQVFLYVTRVHPNMEKVLAHYEQQGFVSLTDFNYPPPYVDDPLLRRLWTLVERSEMFSLENVYFTDCLLRNMHKLRFLAHFDPDEMPVLLQHASLPQFVQHLLNLTRDWPEPPPSYLLQWQYFPSDVAPSHGQWGPRPQYLHLLGHDRRMQYDPNELHKNFKSLYDTSDTTGAFSHRSVACASGSCYNPQQVDMTVAYLGHFSGQCGQRCQQDSRATVVEPTIHRYSSKAAERVTRVLEKLQLLPTPTP